MYNLFFEKNLKWIFVLLYLFQKNIIRLKIFDFSWHSSLSF
ncbi:hypothetical protein LEP1GSC013_0505 [Leptospira interrogans serovar Valbuzzi str. Duyster]|nr:hypothetical protein LEP1GSC013_0505 [Leptospira interrogans serovar Valbuzzi str. Duyster]ENO73395.1 hypothetical protein LEP1GSC012_3036 [Leptospira interrogans serovar Valbuzzi str. Valbuzzi]